VLRSDKSPSKDPNLYRERQGICRETPEQHCHVLHVGDWISPSELDINNLLEIRIYSGHRSSPKGCLQVCPESPRCVIGTAVMPKRGGDAKSDRANCLVVNCVPSLHEIPSRLWVVCTLLDFGCWCCLYGISSRLWVVCISSAWFWLLTLPAWNPIQGVSCVHLLCLILIADVACMKSHPGCELCVPPLFDFDCWCCLHGISSRVWVVYTSSAWFWLLMLSPWNPIQGVSCVQPPLLDFDCWYCFHGISSREWVVCNLLCLILIADVACIKSHPGCELCAPLLLDFDCWCCLHGIPSREWVVYTSSAWFWLLTLPAWNLIQIVSCVHLLCLILIADVACMESHSVGELCTPLLLDFDCWHCLLEISSRLWVVCTSSAWFWLLTWPVWNPQRVNCVHLLCLILIADIAAWNPFSLCVVCTSFAWFWLLTLPIWNPIQLVSCVYIPCLILIADIACMKSHPGCELCAFPLLNYHCWHHLHSGSKLCDSFPWLWSLTYCFIYWLVCSYSIPLPALHSLNACSTFENVLLSDVTCGFTIIVDGISLFGPPILQLISLNIYNPKIHCVLWSNNTNEIYLWSKTLWITVCNIKSAQDWFPRLQP